MPAHTACTGVVQCLYSATSVAIRPPPLTHTHTPTHTHTHALTISALLHFGDWQNLSIVFHC